MSSGDRDPDGRLLTSAEAAARLGIKRETLYAYVSRGVVGRTIGPDGRTSLFDPVELDRLGARRRPVGVGELRATISTGLTRVDDRGLLVRGHDLITIVNDGHTFTEVVDLLWDAPDTETWSDALAEPAPAWPTGPERLSLLDELRIVAALTSAADPLRHDLGPASVRAAGRRLIVALARGLARRHGSDGVDRADAVPSVVGHLWGRLTDEPPDVPKLRALGAALTLLVDHGLAGSSFAARIAASVRADPYSVVTAGLGVVGGTLHGAASGAVHDLYASAEALGDAAEAVGDARRRLGHFPGFGHRVYTREDPRYGALMALLVDAWGADPRLVNVYRVRDVIGARTDTFPNVDTGLGALTYLARMRPDAGECLFAVARTAGWLAHALEEYGEEPLRFRVRARYTGPGG